MTETKKTPLQMRKHVTVKCDEDMRFKLRLYALKHHTTVQDILYNFLTELLKDEEVE